MEKFKSKGRIFLIKEKVKQYSIIQKLLPYYRFISPAEYKKKLILLYIRIRYQKNNMKSINYNGLSFSEPSNTSYLYHIINGNTAFEDEINFIANEINAKNPVVFDIGANVGMVTLLLATKIKNSTIYSFEPNKEIFYFLKKNMEDNNINGAAFGIGLSDKNEELFLGPPHKKQHARYQQGDNDHPGLFSVYADESETWTRNRGQVCEFMTLDSFCEKNEITKIDLIKVDVEGHEINVIKGGLKTLKSCKPICKLEFNLFTFKIGKKNPKELFDILYSLDYVIYSLESGGFEETSYKRIISKDGFLNGDIYAFPPDKIPC